MIQRHQDHDETADEVDRLGDGSWIEFLNFIKYPPALVFTLFMLGGNLLALAAIERARLWTTRAGRILQVFGQAPLAYYIAYLWLFAIVGIIGFRQGTGYAVFYLVWIAGLVPLYFVTRWYRASRWRDRQSPSGDSSDAIPRPISGPVTQFTGFRDLPGSPGSMSRLSGEAQRPRSA